MVPKPSPPKRVNCPRPDKNAFVTMALSEQRRLDEVKKMKDRGWTEHFPTYSYKCQCTFWHWTSKDPGKWAEIANLAGRAPSEIQRVTQGR